MRVEWYGESLGVFYNCVCVGGGDPEISMSMAMGQRCPRWRPRLSAKQGLEAHHKKIIYQFQ